MSSNDLASKQFWNTKYGEVAVVRDAWFRRFARRHTDRLLRRMLYSLERPPLVLELGCAPGRMLCRMHSVRSDCCFSGIDYSQTGVDVTRRVLAANRIDATIYQNDVFDSAIEPKYDFVVSYGLVEHFRDPTQIIAAHAKFCRPGGSVFVTIPNFAAWPVKRMASWLAPSIAAKHNFEIMSESALRGAMCERLTNVKTGAVGGPRIWMELDKGGWQRRVFNNFAKAWNFTASMCPGGLLWQATYWGHGQCPEEGLGGGLKCC